METNGENTNLERPDKAQELYSIPADEPDLPHHVFAMELFQAFIVKIRQRIRAVCMEPPGKLSQKLVDGVQTIPSLFCVQASCST